MTTDRIMSVLVATTVLGGIAALVGIAWSMPAPKNAEWFPWAISALAVPVGASVVVLVVDVWKRP